MDETNPSKPPEEFPQQTLENHEPQSLKKILWKGFSLGIIIVIVVGIIAFLLFNSINKPAPSEHPKPTPTKPKTNNNAWKTYTDNNVHFSFNYPKDWYIEKTSSFTSVPNGYNGWLTVLTDSTTFTDPNKLILCSESQDSSKACLQDGNNKKAIEEITLNGYTAKSFYLGGQGDLALHVVQINGPQNQQVELSTSVFVEGTDKIFTKILNTFKFTSQLPMVGNFIWNVPANSISAEEEQEIKTAFAAFKLPEAKQNKTTHLSVDTIIISSESADFASARLTVRDKGNNILPTDGIQYYLQKNNSQWEIITGSDPNFCQKMKNFPNDLIDTNSYYEYYGCPK